MSHFGALPTTALAVHEVRSALTVARGRLQLARRRLVRTNADHPQLNTDLAHVDAALDRAIAAVGALDAAAVADTPDQSAEG